MNIDSSVVICSLVTDGSTDIACMYNGLYSDLYALSQTM